MAEYCDTNFLLRLFADLPASDQVELRLAGRDPAGGAVPIVWLHRLELPNALQQMVLLARSGGAVQITPENALLGLARFEDEVAAGRRFVATPVAMGDLVSRARELSLRHTARHGFRAYDVAHVACALLLGCDAFWSFDTRASKLAKLEGLKTL